MAAIITEGKERAATSETAESNGNGHRPGKVRVRLMDHQRYSRSATLPTRVPLSQVKEQIIEKLEASPFDSNGQPVVYNLLHRGKVLTDDDTLESIGVMTNDEVELSPNIQGA